MKCQVMLMIDHIDIYSARNKSEMLFDSIRVAQLRIGKMLTDRPIQLLYPLELHCEGITTTNEDEKKNELNPSATEFRPKGTAAEIAKWRLKDITIEEDDGDI